MFHQNFHALLKDDARLETLVKEILQNGFVVVRDFFDTETLTTLHSMAADPRYQNKKNPEINDSLIGKIGFSDEIIQLSQKICDIRSRLTGKPTVTIVREKQAIGMPFKRATDATNIETAYHYDGAYINLLFALTMPPDTKKGDGNLILFPSIRERYAPFLAKVVSRLLRHSKLFRRLYGYSEVVYEVDAMHIFFGDISFHGVEPIKSGERAVITINSHW
jgi:hypothetical protein